jgi:TIR domain
MTKIFISYRRQETIDTAGRIYDWLVHRGIARDDIFMDVDSIPLAADFRAAVNQAILQSQLMLVIIGQQWLTLEDTQGRRLNNVEDTVRIEIETALQHQVAVLPVLVQGATMPAAAHLPEPIRGLAYLNALAVRSAGPDFQHDMESLLAFLVRAGQQTPRVNSLPPNTSLSAAVGIHSSGQPPQLINRAVATHRLRASIHHVSRVPLRAVTALGSGASVLILWWCLAVFGPGRLLDTTNLAAPFIWAVAVGSCLVLLLNVAILLSNTLSWVVGVPYTILTVSLATSAFVGGFLFVPPPILEFRIGFVLLAIGLVLSSARFAEEHLLQPYPSSKDASSN